MTSVSGKLDQNVIARLSEPGCQSPAVRARLSEHRSKLLKNELNSTIQLPLF